MELAVRFKWFWEIGELFLVLLSYSVFYWFTIPLTLFSVFPLCDFNYFFESFRCKAFLADPFVFFAPIFMSFSFIGVEKIGFYFLTYSNISSFSCCKVWLFKDWNDLLSFFRMNSAFLQVYSWSSKAASGFSTFDICYHFYKSYLIWECIKSSTFSKIPHWFYELMDMFLWARYTW